MPCWFGQCLRCAGARDKESGEGENLLTMSRHILTCSVLGPRIQQGKKENLDKPQEEQLSKLCMDIKYTKPVYTIATLSL